MSCIFVIGHPVGESTTHTSLLIIYRLRRPKCGVAGYYHNGPFSCESAARELLPVRSDRHSSAAGNPAQVSAVCIAWEPNAGPGPDPRDCIRHVAGARPGARLDFGEHFQPGDARPLAPVPPVPDTGLCTQAFASLSCRESWRVPSLDPGPAA